MSFNQIFLSLIDCRISYLSVTCFGFVYRPLFGEFIGETSVWGALSPEVIQASLNLTPEFEQVFRARIKKSTILVPPHD